MLLPNDSVQFLKYKKVHNPQEEYTVNASFLYKNIYDLTGYNYIFFQVAKRCKTVNIRNSLIVCK